MNSQILERIYGDKTVDIMRSVALFVAMVVVISVVGFIFFAAH